MKTIQFVFQEIERHLEILQYTINEINKIPRLDTSIFDYKNIVVLLDAFIFRFVKLQNTIGEKLFPETFEIVTGKSRTDVTFIDILNILEKYHFLPSTSKWQYLRQIRNDLVHIYPWDSSLRLEAIKAALNSSEFMIKVYQNIKKRLNE